MMLRHSNSRRGWLRPAGPRIAAMLTVLIALMLAPSLAAASVAPTLYQMLVSGHADEALRALQSTAAKSADDWNLIGRVYFALGQWDDAVRNGEHAVQLAPNNAQFQLWLGRSYGEKANSAGALSAYSLARKSVAAFTTAHQLDPENIAIARDLGEYYASAPAIVGGGAVKALALAAQLDARHPSDAAWVRALVAVNGHDYARAEESYKASIAAAPQQAAPRLEYARFLKNRKRYDETQRAVAEALAAQTVRPEDRYDAAELLLNAGVALPTAAGQLRAYIGSHQTVEAAPLFRAHFLLGEVLVKCGDRAEAVEHYRAALALAATYRPALNALARLGVR
jgi:tetratricopeptide (TPR) repeat protein